MHYSFVCDNKTCYWYGQIRTVLIRAIYPGLYNIPDPICECGFQPRKVDNPD